jgi:DNA-binding GntR family transcriptional regulator
MNAESVTNHGNGPVTGHINRTAMKAITPQPMASVQAAAQIRTAILNGSLPPGTRIAQEDLAAKLGVSREPVRQALIVLEREGLVSNTAGRGAVVALIDPAFISEVYEFREIIESFSAAKAATLSDFDPTPLRKIIAAGERARQAANSELVIDLDLQFHNGIYGLSMNRVVDEVMQTQWSHIRRAMLMSVNIRGYRHETWEEHAAIVDAIANRRAAQASKLAALHCKNARTAITAALTKLYDLTK